MLGYNIIMLVWIPLLLTVAFFEMRRNASFFHTLSMLFFTTYLGALVAVTLFPFPFQSELLLFMRNGGSTFVNNFVPFKTINDVLAEGTTQTLLRQIGGNILLLMPLTFLLPVLWERFRALRSALLVAALASLSIEILQITISAILGFTYKSADVDDLLLNTIGGLAGYGFYVAIKSLLVVCLKSQHIAGRIKIF